MSGIGDRLREERERLRLSQAAFGEIGGVKANAQGKYESGERYPGADYLAAVAEAGVDVLYVVTGKHALLDADALTNEEARVLEQYRSMSAESKASITRVAEALANYVVNK
jgi:transcriptional regulator with XRE-family HTH domain